jgi:hypothetical protein
MAIAAFTTRKAAAHFSLYDADVLRLPRLPLLRLLLRGSSILK